MRSSGGHFYPPGYEDDSTYDEEERVRFNDEIYESLVDDNFNNTPSTSPTYWKWIGVWVSPVSVGAAANCTIRGSNVKGPFAEVNGGAGLATLRVENCRLHYVETDVIETDANGHWKTVDCTDGSGNPLDNAGNWPLDGRYVLPGGRSGGQTVNGGTDPSENLALVSTTNATKGAIILGNNVFRVGPGDVARLAQYALQFAASTGVADDVGIKRNAAGVLQITNASSGLGSLLCGSSLTTNVSLAVRAITAQSANLTQWQNTSGTALLAVTKDGHVVTPFPGTFGTPVAAANIVLTGGNGSNADTGLQDPIDGGAGATVSITAGNGGSGWEGGVGGNGGSISLQAGAGGAGSSTGAAGEVVVNNAGNPQNFRVESDGDANCLLVDGVNNAIRLGGQEDTRVYQNAPDSAPGDSNLTDSQISFYLDETGDKLKFKAKYKNGMTVKIGEVAFLP